MFSDLEAPPEDESKPKPSRKWTEGRKRANRGRKKRARVIQPRFFPGKVLVWFSCGASSAVALKLALEEYGPDKVAAFYCDTSEDEHPDNLRFLADCEKWTGATIHKVKSRQFKNV